MLRFQAVLEVPGLYLCENIVSEEEETIILEGRAQIKPSPYTHNQTLDNPHTTRTGQSNVSDTTQNWFPDWLQEFWRTSMEKTNLCEIIKDTGMFDNCYIHEYASGIVLFPHVDNVGIFGEWICGLSLMSDVTMDFFPPDRKGEVRYYSKKFFNDGQAVLLPRRSMYIMTGDARFKWAHGIRKVENKRVSLTIRMYIDDHLLPHVIDERKRYKREVDSREANSVADERS